MNIDPMTLYLDIEAEMNRLRAAGEQPALLIMRHDDYAACRNDLFPLEIKVADDRQSDLPEQPPRLLGMPVIHRVIHRNEFIILTRKDMQSHERYQSD